MFKTCVIGASGYTGCELARLLQQHPHFELSAIYVSENSADANTPVNEIHPYLSGIVELPLTPISPTILSEIAESMDAIFLATPHEASHQWMSILTGNKARIFDLSGAFRIKDTKVFESFYGFEHKQQDLLQQAVYGLTDWYSDQIKTADVVAVPGCYPTASLTALKPLQVNQYIDSDHRPIINAVSGVSGAGRKAALNNSFCEVSLQAYGVLGHRHQPEISNYLGAEVIFTPHLGNFKRGILATITVKINSGVTAAQIEQVYLDSYQHNPMVRLQSNWPKLDNVVNTPYCDLYWKYDEQSQYLVISSAIDNLLKGAASQALQCANLRFGFDHWLSLHKGAR